MSTVLQEVAHGAVILSADLNQIIDGLTNTTVVDFTLQGAMTHNGGVSMYTSGGATTMFNLLGLTQETSVRHVGIMRGTSGTVEVIQPNFNMQIRGAFNQESVTDVSGAPFVVRSQLEGSGTTWSAGSGNLAAYYQVMSIVHDNSNYSGGFGAAHAHDSVALVGTARTLRNGGPYNGSRDSTGRVFGMYLQTENASKSGSAGNEIFFNNSMGTTATGLDAGTGPGRIVGLEMVSGVNLSDGTIAGSLYNSAFLMFTNVVAASTTAAGLRGIYFGQNSVRDEGIDFSGGVTGIQNLPPTARAIRLHNSGTAGNTVSSIVARNFAGTADLNVLGLDSANYLRIRNGSRIYFESDNTSSAYAYFAGDAINGQVKLLSWVGGQNAAVGGGSAATIGTIYSSGTAGPTTQAQSGWLRMAVGTVMISLPYWV